MAQEAWETAQNIQKANRQGFKLQVYQQDPVGFGENVLKEHFTDGIRRVMESVRDYPVTIARSANDVGKSHGAARVAIWFYKVFARSQVYITAAPPLENLRRILWGEIMSVVERNPEFFKYDRIKSLQILKNSQSFISGVAIPTSGTVEEREAKFSGKHSPNLLFIVDEGDAVPDEIYKGIESCMSGGNAHLLIMFNPRAQSGPVYLKEINHEANVIELSAFDHPNVSTGIISIPGAVTRESTVRRINEWTRSLQPNEPADIETFEVPDFLVGQTAFSMSGIEYAPLKAERRKIVEPAFSYMVLGKYPPQSEFQLINQAWIDAARTRWELYVSTHGEAPPEIITPRMGVDVGELGTDYNVACLRYGGFVSRMILWQGVDSDFTARKALDLYYTYNVDIALIDATGVGSSVAPSMGRLGKADNVRAIAVKMSEKPLLFIKTEMGEFRMLRDQLWWAMREWLRTDNTSMIPPDPYLVEELKTPTYKVGEKTGKIEVMGKDTMRDLLKRSPDRADALMLTFYPFRKPTFMRLSP